MSFECEILSDDRYELYYNKILQHVRTTFTNVFYSPKKKSAVTTYIIQLNSLLYI